jgi:uncharacterized BrkB/YihY/UPF0761 family membrane protein
VIKDNIKSIIKKWLTDIRDYAYLLEKKQYGEAQGKVRYKDKLLVIFYVYYFVIMGGPLYIIRAFYHLPIINKLQNTDLFTKLILGIVFIVIPFEIFHFCISKYLVTSPLPIDGVDEETFKSKKKVYWTTFMIGVLLIALLVFITVQIGSVVHGPIF